MTSQAADLFLVLRLIAFHLISLIIGSTGREWGKLDKNRLNFGRDWAKLAESEVNFAR